MLILLYPLSGCSQSAAAATDPPAEDSDGTDEQWQHCRRGTGGHGGEKHLWRTAIHTGRIDSSSLSMWIKTKSYRKQEEAV